MARFIPASLSDNGEKSLPNAVSHLEFRLQGGAHAVQNPLWHPTGKLRGNSSDCRQLAFAIEESILHFTQQIFGKIQRLLQR
ncbi:hypothetical protein D3C80_1601800 [compost metagenome]